MIQTACTEMTGPAQDLDANSFVRRSDHLGEFANLICISVADDHKAQFLCIRGLNTEGVVLFDSANNRQRMCKLGRPLKYQYRNLVLAHGEDQLRAWLLMQVDQSSAEERKLGASQLRMLKLKGILF